MRSRQSGAFGQKYMIPNRRKDRAKENDKNSSTDMLTRKKLSYPGCKTFLQNGSRVQKPFLWTFLTERTPTRTGRKYNRREEETRRGREKAKNKKYIQR